MVCMLKGKVFIVDTRGREASKLEGVWGSVAWTLKCVTGTCDTVGSGGQCELWCADRHHRRPFVPSASDKGNYIFWWTGNWLSVTSS